MSIMQFLPSLVRELLKHVPKLGFEVTDWEGVRRDAPLMAARLLSQSGVAGLKKAQESVFSSFLVFSAPPTPPGSDPQEFGDLLLRYYFSQLQIDEGVFLDLRPENFSQSPGRLHFSPNGFWYRFSPTFRQSLLELYDGFYFDREDLFERGLRGTGLLSGSWSPEDQERMKTLFRSHFGTARDLPMRFNLEDFQKTFLSVFEFLMEKKVRLSSEFMLFGAYLVTLYLALQKTGTRHDVGRIYRELRRPSVNGSGQ
jgi:predicted unusual protein kinase regulating ubiquinone biosynthesis (AarF/ABC1/UbiB family)